MAVHCAEYDRILDNLFLGGIFGSFKPELLKQQGITHILTLLDRPLPQSCTGDFTYKFVYALDMEIHNLLHNLEECLEFMQKGMEEGSVLVHCAAGASRSATVVIAYIMRTRHLSLEEALQFVRERRPIVGPNDGFMEQLELYEKMGCRVDSSNEEFRRYTLSNVAFGIKIGFQQPCELPTDFYHSEKKPSSPKDTVYKCRICRQPLFRSSALMAHKKGKGSAAFDWRSKIPANQREASPEGDQTKEGEECYESLFIEPVEWMRGHVETSEGKLACPKCQSKLGSFVWYGEPCPCGAWVAPAFHIQRSKVDEIKPVVTVPTMQQQQQQKQHLPALMTLMTAAGPDVDSRDIDLDSLPLS